MTELDSNSQAFLEATQALFTPETFELFPGFKTPPNDPSREIKEPIGRPAIRITAEPMDDAFDDFEFDGDFTCKACDGYGYFDCFCGGDFCVCSYNGERPCWECA